MRFQPFRVYRSQRRMQPVAGRMFATRFYVVSLSILAAEIFCGAQSAPPGRGPARPFSGLNLGAGVSTFYPDWPGMRVQGETIWIDYEPPLTPRTLHGLGIEVEARDLNSKVSLSPSKNYRLYTIGSGGIFRWPHFDSVRPYAKCLMSFGTIEWNNPNPNFRHETRTVWAPGLGGEFRIVQTTWVRADYEYQFWPDINKNRPGSGNHVLNPNGFTFGISYGLFRKRQ